MKDLIVKDNALINASYNLDLVEQRLILLAIIEARESGKGINANDPLTIHAESYINHFDVLKNGAYLSYSLIENDDYTSELTYSYSKYKIKNDHSISSLKRDANNHQLRSDNVLNSNILFNFAYDIHNADGKASSYDKYSLGLGYIYEINDSFDVTFLGNIGQTSYKETNTILNKKIKRKDKTRYEKIKIIFLVLLFFKTFKL